MQMQRINNDFCKIDYEVSSFLFSRAFQRQKENFTNVGIKMDPLIIFLDFRSKEHALRKKFNPPFFRASMKNSTLASSTAIFPKFLAKFGQPPTRRPRYYSLLPSSSSPGIPANNITLLSYVSPAAG